MPGPMKSCTAPNFLRSPPQTSWTLTRWEPLTKHSTRYWVTLVPRWPKCPTWAAPVCEPWSAARGEVNSTLVTETHLDGDLPIGDFAILDVPADGLNLEPVQIPQ